MKQSRVSYQLAQLLRATFFLSLFLFVPLTHVEAATCPNGQSLLAKTGGSAPPNTAFACEDDAPGFLGATWFPKTHFYDSGGIPLSERASQGGDILQQQVDAENEFNAPSSCDSTLANLASPATCLWRGFMSGLGSVAVYVSTSILTLSGLLFNAVIEKTILNLTVCPTVNTCLLSPGLMTAINISWTFFRDMANLLIIGFFVFIAIGIILGLKEYGQKKLVARVLIIAVLINFSLLFTRIIINTTNSVAVLFASKQQIADAQHPDAIQSASISGLATGAASVTGSALSAAPTGIAGEFLKTMGIVGFYNTWGALSKLASKDSNQSGWLALFYGLMIAVLVLGFAIVLLYGSFLLIARAVILVILMVTSSIAFASYLMPSWSDGSYGWSKWWSTLIQNALLAPALMMFLWMTLMLAKRLQSQGGSIGNFLADPTNNKLDAGAFFSYFVILGLLYAGIRLSNSFAGAAGKFAMNGTARFGIRPVAGIIGSIGTHTVGRGAYAIAGGLAKQAQKQTAKDTMTGKFMGNLYGAMSEQAKKGAKRDFNPANLATTQSLGKTLGLDKKQIGATDKHGFEGILKKRREEKIARAGIVTLSDANAKKTVEKARTQASAEPANAATPAKNERNLIAEGIKSLAESQKGLEKEISALNTEQLVMNMKVPKDAPESKSLDQKIADKKSAFDEQKRRIESAMSQAEKIKPEVEKEIAARMQQLIPKGLLKTDSEGRAIIGKDGRPEIKSEHDRKADIATNLAYERLTNAPLRAFGLTSKDSDVIAKGMRQAIKDHDESKSFKKIVDAVKKEGEKTHTHDEKIEKHATKVADQNTAHIVDAVKGAGGGGTGGSH